MMERLERLIAAINEKRPLVLVLGQDAWRGRYRNDPVISAALKRIGRHSELAEQKGYTSLLEKAPLPDDFYSWLAEQYSNRVEADWFEPIVKLPLSAVFTSSIDPSIPRILRRVGRDVESVLSNFDNPIAPRQRSNLHLTYLFGRAGESSPNEAPPKSLQELYRRTSIHASVLLSRLIETTTPLGVVVIDGLDCSRDWLTAESLYGVLSAFKPGQVFWFGWNSNAPIESRELLESLSGQNGPITFIPERMSAAIGTLMLEGRISSFEHELLATSNVVTIGESILDVDPSLRLKTSTAASIFDDAWLNPILPLGEEVAFEEFKRFHGQLEEAKRLVEGIRRGFAMERSFESDLSERVFTALKDLGRNQEPILLHGQSGTGKSLALARLAYEVRKNQIYPVLFASRVSRVPAVDELDEFCLRAEDAGALGTLVICDANTSGARYRDLLRGFQSRGRRVVIVGSSYRLIDQARNNGDKNQLEAPSTLDDVEASKLKSLLKAYADLDFEPSNSEYLLPAIYRLLPNVRPRLAVGLGREARVAEDDLRNRGETLRQSVSVPINALGKALAGAGLVDPKALLERRLDEFLGAMSDAASRVIDYVMVPGKLECPVPINLLMRAVGGSENLVDVSNLFSGIDLFRWSANDEDDIFILPRLKIEAELISARRLGTPQAETLVAIKLINAAIPSSHESCERRFILDMVHKLGPDGPFGLRYSGLYLEIARALTEIRERRGIVDPGFMLQESTLRRRVLRDAPQDLNIEPAEILEEARQIIDLALDEFCSNVNPGLRRMCANLKVERAAIYGFRAVQQLKSGASSSEVWQFYEAARSSARSAVNAADTYYATDVSLWVPADLLKTDSWEPSQQAELTADILDGLERVDLGQLEPEQRAMFEERKAKVSNVLKNNELENEALESLDKMGSHAGTYLRARKIGGELRGLEAVSNEDRSLAGDVVTFMVGHSSSLREDARCIRYLLRARWIQSTGTYLFAGEKSPIPHDDNDLVNILELLDRLEGIEGSLCDVRIKYLRAVLMWRLRREHDAKQIWRELSQETVFNDPRRVVRYHVWTESNGKQKLFHGRIIRENPGSGRVRVKVEEIHQEIELFQRDFPDQELRRGAEVRGGFNVGFNFIGPVAVPLGRRGAMR